MDAALMIGLGKMGAACSMAFAAMGTCLGVCAAGEAAVGAWKRCFAQGKAAPFILVTFVGAPLSQTIYGMILMNNILKAAVASPTNWPVYIGVGLFGGIAIGLSGWFQGKIGAGAADAMGETGKGFGNYLMALGIIETVALFVMVFIGAAIK